MSGIARRYGLGDDAVRRHRNKCLTAALGKAVEEKRLEIDAAKLTDWTGSLQLKTLRLLARAEELDALGDARGLIAEARRNIELLARLGGILDRPTVVVDQRRQLAVLGGLSDDELRRLAASADVIEAAPVRELAA
jgi:hypothetical protein